MVKNKENGCPLFRNKIFTIKILKTRQQPESSMVNDFFDQLNKLYIRTDFI